MKLLHGIVIVLVITNVVLWKFSMEGFSPEKIALQGFRIKAMFGYNSNYGSFQYPIGKFEGYIREYWKLPSIPQDEIRAETIDGDYYFFFRTIYHIHRDDLPPI